MHYYQRHIGDYAKKSGHLTPLEHGVYNLIIDGYYDREQAPTLLEATRWARARTEEEKAAVLAVLDEFFTLEGERYHQSRIDEELAAYRAKAEKNREIAIQRESTKRARKEHEPCTNGAQDVHEACTNRSPEEHQTSTTEAPNHKPITNNQEPVKAEKSNARASRLPADWSPSPEDITYCQAQRPELDPARVAENFRDYWHAKAGADARKTNWAATWRTWVRNERSLPQGRASPQHYESAKDRRRRETMEALTGRASHAANDIIDITPTADPFLLGG